MCPRLSETFSRCCPHRQAPDRWFLRNGEPIEWSLSHDFEGYLATDEQAAALEREYGIELTEY